MKIMRKTLLASAMITLFSVNSYAKTPIDLGVVNEDKLIEMLVRQGLVDENASDQERHSALDRYLKNKINSGFKGDAQFGKKAMELRAKILKPSKKSPSSKKRVFSHWKWVPSAQTKCSRCLSTSLI